MSKTTIDPALQARLDSARVSSHPIAVVIKLRSEEAGTTLPPEETKRVTEKILERVREHLGEKESYYLVLDMLGAFKLLAPANFVVDVMKQPEVAGAVSAEEEKSAYIPPRNVREVRLDVKSRHRSQR
jgi:hypothetical protein